MEVGDVYRHREGKEVIIHSLEVKFHMDCSTIHKEWRPIIIYECSGSLYAREEAEFNRRFDFTGRNIVSEHTILFRRNFDTQPEFAPRLIPKDSL